MKSAKMFPGKFNAWLPSDFKKRGGYQRSMPLLSAEHHPLQAELPRVCLSKEAIVLNHRVSSRIQICRNCPSARRDRNNAVQEQKLKQKTKAVTKKQKLKI